MEKYFKNSSLLENTLLPYFCNEHSLKSINKKFLSLNYDKYNTHYQPHGAIEIYDSKYNIIKAIKYYKNGNLVRSKEFENNYLFKIRNYKNEKLHGKIVTWYESSFNLHNIVNYKNSIPNGIFEYYYENGNLKEKGYNKNGEEDGLYRTYHSNSKIREKSYYKNGLLDGLHEEWNSLGKLRIRCIYKNDKLDGQYEEYNCRGQLFVTKKYEDGVLIDVWI